jgi:hypothetical protein
MSLLVAPTLVVVVPFQSSSSSDLFLHRWYADGPPLVTDSNHRVGLHPVELAQIVNKLKRFFAFQNVDHTPPSFLQKKLPPSGCVGHGHGTTNRGSNQLWVDKCDRDANNNG